MIRSSLLILTLSAFLSPLLANGAVVLDFANQATLQSAEAKGAELSLVTNEGGAALRVVTSLGHKWPGATFTMDEAIDASQHGYVTFHLKNASDVAMQIRCRIDSRPKGAEESDAVSRLHKISLAPGDGRDIRLPLIPYVKYPGIKPEDFFGMRGKPFFSSESMHLENLFSFVFFVVQEHLPLAFEVGSVRLEGEQTVEVSPTFPEQVFPLIDQFGQFKHKDWPGKTHSLEELRQQAVDEAEWLASTPPPASWNKYGGWKDGPQLEATGWFRTAKHEGKWHLVDPDGKLFFSLGIDGVAFKHGTIQRVLRDVAPNHLYLGCRYGNSAPINPIVMQANAEFADVVSFNVYSRYLADKLPRLERAGDKPYIIGEFHYGALDRGMFDTGLVAVADQDERAAAFSQFVLDCVKHPNIVGCHWFQFCDSPTTGRLWDHENYQIGFTDTVDRPYAELIEASRKVGEKLYE